MLPRNRSIPDCTVIPTLAYRDVGEAVTWLCATFGFEERLRIGDHRAQLVFGDGAMVVTQRAGVDGKSTPGSSHTVMVRVKDVFQHHDNAARLGATIVRAPADYPYGERQYTVEDLGGHVWTFTQTIADSDPASWGGVLVKG
jgi:uncharacterized glyoxalase superfamily protein PhnB